jgi:hypothetical protein
MKLKMVCNGNRCSTLTGTNSKFITRLRLRLVNLNYLTLVFGSLINIYSFLFLFEKKSVL